MKKPYDLAMIITNVQCQSCKNGISPNAPLMVRSKTDLIGAGELLHSSSNIICGNPKLIILYQPAFVDTSLFPEIDESTLQKANAARDN